MNRINAYAANPSHAVPAVRFAIRSYRANESSARDLISTVWNVLDNHLEHTASIISGFVSSIFALVQGTVHIITGILSAILTLFGAVLEAAGGLVSNLLTFVTGALILVLPFVCFLLPEHISKCGHSRRPSDWLLRIQCL